MPFGERADRSAGLNPAEHNSLPRPGPRGHARGFDGSRVQTRHSALEALPTKLEKGIDMSVKRRVLAVAATLTIAAGVITVGTISASAATPACDGGCISIFSREVGSYAQPNA